MSYQKVGPTFSRRRFIEKIGQGTAALSATPLFVSPLLAGLTRSAFGQSTAAASELKRHIAPGTGIVLTPADRNFASYKLGFNKRLWSGAEAVGAPEAILIAQSPEAIAAAVQWANAHGKQIRMKSGGHSYEGFSQGSGVLIDVRELDKIEVDRAARTVSVGAGVKLGNLYAENFKHGLVVPAGSCGTVGVAGLVTGGGFGLLSRRLGLTCDSLVGAQIVDAQGRVLEVSERSHAGLFWALRGGGGGTFGVATRFDFRAHPIGNVTRFILTFSKETPRKTLLAWQSWMRQAPDAITSVCNISGGGGKVAVRIVGQMVGTEAELRAALRELPAMQDKPEKISHVPLIQSVLSLGGKVEGVAPEWFKASSDYAFEALDESDAGAILEQVRTSPGATVLLDSYGGAVERVAQHATAFAHRDALFSVQYYASTPAGAEWIRRARPALNPHLSRKGGRPNRAYVNYCDLDIRDWKSAYWGENYRRLAQVKTEYDRANLFRHAQSVQPG